MYTLSELQSLILKWAEDKNLIRAECIPKQQLKLLEEVGETAQAVIKSDVEALKDGVGDIFVVLIILAAQKGTKYNIDEWEETEDEFFQYDKGSLEIYEIFDRILGSGSNYFYYQHLKVFCIELELDLTECANHAWNEIKDRKGKTVNGSFIKE